MRSTEPSSQPILPLNSKLSDICSLVYIKVLVVAPQAADASHKLKLSIRALYCHLWVTPPPFNVSTGPVVQALQLYLDARLGWAQASLAAAGKGSLSASSISQELTSFGNAVQVTLPALLRPCSRPEGNSQSTWVADERAADLGCVLQHSCSSTLSAGPVMAQWWPLHLCCRFTVHVRCSPGSVLHALPLCSVAQSSCRPQPVQHGFHQLGIISSRVL